MWSILKRVTRLLMLLVVMSVFGVGKVRAQSITPAADGTGTNVTTKGNQYDIDGGSLSGDGANLFHSFEQFGLSQGEIANFLSNPNLVNILGRIGGGNPSVINGLIQVTGGNSNLFLMNPAGFVFGNSVALNVPGSFTATTANGIGFGGGWFSAMGGNDYQVLVGNPIGFGFTVAQPGGIVNEGNLAVGVGQNLSLVGGAVVNTGELKAPGGGVVVSAVPGENWVRLSVPGNVLSLEVQPLGGNQPNGWNLPITALPDLLTVGTSGVQGNPDGTVQVAGVQVPGDAGTAIVSGKVDVSGETGGTVGVFGDKVAVVGAEIDAAGVNGGGRVLVGGDYQGKGTVPNAQRTLVDGGSVINADAGVNGDGGRVIVWADEATGFSGSISARGGSNSGNGGFAEVSGKANLRFDGIVDVGTINGSLGTLLLDPLHITISNEASTAGVDQALPNIFGHFVPDPVTINAEKLQAQTGNVFLRAQGHITIANGVSLNFVPGGSITFSADGEFDGFGGGLGDFSMDQTQSITAPGREIRISGVNITVGNINTSSSSSNGGNITLIARGSRGNPLFPSGGILDTTGGTLNSSSSVNGGAITLEALGKITTTDINSSASGSGTSGNINITSSSGAIDTSAGTIDSSSTSGTGGQIKLDAATNITPGNIKTTNNNINLDDPVNLTTDTSINIEGTGGNVNFNNTVNGNHNLTVNVGSGDTNFNSQVGNTQSLGNIQANSTGTTRINSTVQATSLTTNAGGETQINGNITTTGTNGQNYGDNVRIDNNTTLDSNNNPININGTVNSQTGENNNLTANAGTSNITITGEVGNTQPLGNIQANSTGTTRINSTVQATSLTTNAGGETQINSNITTTGTNGQNYNDNVRIDNNVTLDSNNNPININGTINSQPGETNNLNINSGSSNTTLNGDAGNTNPLGDININSTNNITTPNLTANNINLTSGNNITTGNLNTNSTTGNSGSVNLTATGNINTNNINTNSTTGNSGAVNITATGNTNTANINTNSTSGNGGEIAIQGTNVTTGNLNSSGNSGGNTSIQATTSIKTGTINSSGTSGNGGNVTLDPENDIEVNSINAQGGANGVGGNVDITTEQNFRATGTFTDQNGINASISTAGGQGGGPVTIRHGGGSQNTPFVVGDATTNGTAGAITTGENNTIAPVQSFPGSYTQGTPPNQIQIITQDQPNGGEIPNNSEVVEQPPAPPIQTEPQRPVDTIVDEIENYFTTQADKYVGGNTRIKTLDEIRNDLRQVEQATNGEIKPGVIYAFFSPRGPVVRPELDAEGFPRQPNIALEAPLQLVLVTSTGEVINKFIPNATRTNVFKEVANLRRDLDSQSQEGNEKYLKSAEQFYDWLIRPIEKDLEAQGVNNLVFVMDEKLGSVPLAAMRDRQDNQFIIQKGYSIGLTPSMSLINIRDANSRNVLKNAHVLAMGARDFKNLTPLPGAEVEIDFILDLWQGESFLNDQFTVENLKEAHNTGSYQIIHLATHAKFEQGERNNSFIQFGGGKLVELDEIPKLGLDNPSVELLVLSACNTALGNKDAELGFAGFARIAGVKSVVASLWSISDVRSLGLMTQFYTQLKTAPIKAEALRQAQLALLEGKVKIENGELVSDEYRIRLPGEDNNNQPLSHPYYWSGFTMIGNPW